jgi:hypothetical protein
MERKMRSRTWFELEATTPQVVKKTREEHPDIRNESKPFKELTILVLSVVPSRSRSVFSLWAWRVLYKKG